MGDEVAAPRKPLWRRMLRWLAWATAGLLVLVVGLVIFLHTSWGKEVVRSRVEKALGKRVNGELTIGRLDYTFLFGEVSLADVRIADASGEPAIGLDGLSVDLDRSSLLDGAPVLERVEISGVSVDIRQRADGTSNLTGLFVKSKRKKQHIEVRALSLADTRVTIHKPDGAVIAVSDVGLAGSASINSKSGNHHARLSKVAASVAITRPDGTTISVPSLETALSATVKGADLEVELAPIAVVAAIAKPEEPAREVPIALGGVSVARTGSGPVAIDASIKSLQLGPLRVELASAGVSLADGKPRGEQSIAIKGIHLAHAELAALLGRPVISTDVDGQLTVRGPADNLILTGGFDTAGGRIELDGAVNAANLEKLVYKLSVTGTGLETAKLAPAEGRPSLESTLALTLSGEGIPRREGSRAALSLSAGPSVVNVRGKSIAIESLEVQAHTEGRAAELDVLKLRGFGLDVVARGRLSATRRLSASLEIDGNPRQAAASVRALGVRVRPLPLPSSLSLGIGVDGQLDGDLDIDIAPTSIAIAGGRVQIRSASATVSRAGPKPRLTRADAEIGLSRLDIGKLARIARRKTTLGGRIDGDLEIHQRGAARDIGYDLRVRLREPDLDVAARGALSASAATVVATARSPELGETVATIEAKVPLRTRGGARTIAPGRPLALDVVIPRRTLDEVARLAPPRIADRLRQRASAGSVEAKISLRGTLARPTGSVDIDAEAELARLPGQRVALDLAAAVSPGAGGRVTVAPTATARVVGIDGDIVTIGGQASLGPLVTRGRLDAKGAARSARLDVAVAIPERSLASLAPLREKLAGLPGLINGTVAVAGTPRDPALVAAIAWTGLETAAGAPSQVTIDATGGPKKLNATLSIGANKEVTIGAIIDRGPRQTRIAARARASAVDLATVLPAEAKGAGIVESHGTLDWKMDGAVTIEPGAGLTALDLRGALDVTGARIAVPRSERTIRDIALRLEADGQILRLSRLEAHETDIEKKDRSLAISGEVALSSGRPTAGKLSIETRDWLVFGGSLGEPDAPRATATASIEVAADLRKDTPVIDATIHRLELVEPERFYRGHALEQLAAGGDVFMLGDSRVALGKLAPPRDPGPAAAPRKMRPMTVHVHIPKPVHVKKIPIDVFISGDLDITTGESGLVPRGELAVHDGEVDLFGHKHRYRSGVIRFDEAHPKGELNLVFARPLRPATLRELSRVSGGMAVKIKIERDIPNRKISLLGAGNSGMLEVMSAHNAGRSYYTTEPDLPATASVQVPRGEQPLIMTFLATNLPHLMLLQRFGAWSDPYDSRESYDRVEHIDGERAAADNRSRVKIVGRPESLGRSSVEVHYDRLLRNTASIAVGAGVRAGSRLGGGLGVFFEWSSQD